MFICRVNFNLFILILELSTSIYFIIIFLVSMNIIHLLCFFNVICVLCSLIQFYLDIIVRLHGPIVCWRIKKTEIEVRHTHTPIRAISSSPSSIYLFLQLVGCSKLNTHMNWICFIILYNFTLNCTHYSIDKLLA